jgi:H+-transporting ATPase
MARTKPDRRDKNKEVSPDSAPGKVEREFGSLPAGELMKRLATTSDGLGQAEAQSRLSQYGYNELVEEKVNPLLKFLR